MRRPAMPLFLVLLVACASSRPPAAPPAQAASTAESAKSPGPASGPPRSDALASLAQRYLFGLFRAKPHLADYLGDHRFATEHWDLSSRGVGLRVAELTEQKNELAALDRSKMSPDDQVDAAIMADGIGLE
ncbi:MAG: hypothetical protein ACJ78Z_18795, partial [Myxococcales bacterium]